MITAAHSLDETALVFHALSDPTRLRIIALLRRGERCVCELTEALDAAQSRLSFHLKTLKDAGIVADRRDGRRVHYRLHPDALETYGDILGALPSAGWTRKGECCA